jgi:hypothetical protein
MAIAVGTVEAIETIGGPNPSQTLMVGKHGQTPAVGFSPIVFSVNNQVVSFDGTFQVIAAAGDELVVAGTIKNDGILHATAYENLTRAVGRNGVASRAMMLFIYGCVLSGFLFFGWAISFFSQDDKASILVPIMLGGMAGSLGLGWFARHHNHQMANDAAELEVYARQRLLDNSN